MSIRVGISKGLNVSIASLVVGAFMATAAYAQDTTGQNPSVPTVPAPSFDVPTVDQPAGTDAAASQDGTTEDAVACFLPPIKLLDEDVEAFLANPASLLTDYPDGGLLLSSRVRSLAGSDARTLQPILQLAVGATLEQRAAIGSGLARAATACAPSSERYAALIQESVAGMDNNELLTAFLSATNDLQTAAFAGGIGGGFVGGAPGLGGVGAPGPSSGPFGDVSTPNVDGTFGPFSRRTAQFFGSGANASTQDTNSP